jgi:uncharacterized protein (UPF0548 family)
VLCGVRCCDHERVSELTYPARLQGLSIPLARGATYAAGRWHVMVQTKVIGAGPEDFHLAAQRVVSWQMHRDAGVRVEADSEAAEGVEIAMGIGAGQLRITAECRVVAVADEPREFGFAYGTLARHPERGEEAFLVSWRADGASCAQVPQRHAAVAPCCRSARCP